MNLFVIVLTGLVTLVAPAIGRGGSVLPYDVIGPIGDTAPHAVVGLGGGSPRPNDVIGPIGDKR